MHAFPGRAVPARLALSLVLLSGAAGASEPDGSALSRAHDAYARGAAAYAQGDYARGARELALADALVPDSVTLRAALDSVTLADDPVLGTELVLRAARDPSDPLLARAAEVAERRFAHRTGKIVVRCDDCLALIDGDAVRPGEARVVTPGTHAVVVQRAGAPETRLVKVAIDEVQAVTVRPRVTAVAPAAPAEAAPAAAGGVAPAWFFAAAGVAGVLGAATVVSAVDTADDHSSFVADRCLTSGSASCSQQASSGEAAQARTAWLAGATAVGVVGAAALGVFGVRWRTRHGAEVTGGVTGSAAVLRARF